MKTRRTFTLSDTPGANFRLLQRLERADWRRRQRLIAGVRPGIVQRFLKWLFTA